MLYFLHKLISIFIILNSTGLITVEKIELWLKMANTSHSFYVAAIVSGLLLADLFISVPTLMLTILSGYFLGPVLGFLAAITGLLMAGTCGYGISRKYGDKLVSFLIKDQDKRDEAVQMFQKHGSIVILLSRAMPILPEVSACMAGLTRMSFVKFLFLWLASSIPYVIIASYAGSISSLENPKPAIFAAIGLMAFLWLCCLIFRKIRKDVPAKVS